MNSIRKITITSIFLLSTLFINATEMPLLFIKENIHITLEDKKIYVKGIYYFRNTTDREFDATLNYPFPVDSTHLFPDTISICIADSFLEYNKKLASIEWTMHFSPNQFESVYVEYSQSITENTAIYVLSSTQLWETKLELCKFIIEVPLTINTIMFTLYPDSMKTINNKHFYYITRKHFSPTEDLRITWE